MQFHFNGFRLGDPDVLEADARAQGTGDVMPAEVDVLIVGCGPAGLTLAAQLAAFPEITTAIVEQKDGPLELGQADGVACRTMEMFQAFGFVERVLREAYWVNDTAFWRSDVADPSSIVCGSIVQDTEDGLSEFPHVILNQARVHQFYLDRMRNSPSRMTPFYGRKVVGLTVDRDQEGRPASPHPVNVQLHKGASGEIENVRARYVVGCDGARSAVRSAIGQELKGEAANKAWGVIDALAVTDFPDLRRKCVINNAKEGTIVLIPREGGYMARFYVEMDKLDKKERVASRNITADHLIGAIKRILHPYTFEVKEVAWWSVYEIGQRLCDRFDDTDDQSPDWQSPHVFICGDACHTHSPKAGQGMNVSMQDAFNLGWKLAAVLRGQADPALLISYNSERQRIASELIDFDKEWAAMLSAPVKNSEDESSEGVTPRMVRDYFVRSGRYTAGTATRYPSSILVDETSDQSLAEGFTFGTRFHSAPVVRYLDSKPMHLGHVAEADGRWRLYLFSPANDLQTDNSQIAAVCHFLANSSLSPVVKYTPAGEDIDSVIDVRAVFQEDPATLRGSKLPDLLFPVKGKLQINDYEKVFCADPKSDIFDMRQICREAGCMVLVRPDQYVASVLPLAAYPHLAEFFDNFMISPHAKSPEVKSSPLLHSATAELAPQR